MGFISFNENTASVSTGVDLQFGGATKLSTTSTGATITGTLVAPTINDAGGISLQFAGATKLNTTSTGATVTGTLVASTSIQSPRSIIGSTTSSDNVISISKRVTGITAATTVYTITISGADSVDTFLELVAAGAASGVGNGSRYQLFSILNNGSPLSATSLNTFTGTGEAAGNIPTFSFAGSTTTTLPIRVSSTNSWSGTIFVKLWNATGITSAGVWSIA